MSEGGAVPGMMEAITARFGPIDVLEYAPSGLDLLNVAAAVRDADAASFEFPLDLLLRTPVTLIRQVLPGMLERGGGAVLVGLPVTASIPVPPCGDSATAAAAGRRGAGAGGEGAGGGGGTSRDGGTTGTRGLPCSPARSARGALLRPRDHAHTPRRSAHERRAGLRAAVAPR